MDWIAEDEPERTNPKIIAVIASILLAAIMLGVAFACSAIKDQPHTPIIYEIGAVDGDYNGRQARITAELKVTNNSGDVWTAVPIIDVVDVDGQVMGPVGANESSFVNNTTSSVHISFELNAEDLDRFAGFDLRQSDKDGGIITLVQDKDKVSKRIEDAKRYIHSEWDKDRPSDEN